MKEKLRSFFMISSFKQLLPYILLGLVVAVLEVLGEFLDILQGLNQGLPGYSLNTRDILILGTRGVAWWIFLSVMFFLGWRGFGKIYRGRPSRFSFFGNRLKCWLVIMISWMPCFLAYFPCVYSYDGEPQLIQYTTKAFDNHHPIFHTLIIGWCYDLGQWLISKGINIDGMAFYSIIQMSLLAFALATMMKYLYDHETGRFVLWLTILIVVIFPATPIMAISTTKDTFFAAFFVLLLVSLLRLMDETDNSKVKVYSISIGICAVLCMLFRRNVSYVFILFVLIGGFVYLMNKIKIIFKNPSSQTLSAPIAFMKRIVLISIVSLAVFFSFEKALMVMTDAVQGEAGEALSIPLMQMARAYKSNTAEVTEKYGDVLFKYVTEEGLNNYRPAIADGVKQRFNNQLFARDKVSFIKLYFKMMKDYPGSYIQSLLYLTKGDWEIMDNTFTEVYKDWWRDRTGYLITDATPVFAQRYVNKSNLLPKTRDMYENIVTACSYRRITLLQILFAPALYVLLIQFNGLALMMEHEREKLFIWLIPGLYLLTVLAGPCVLVRYIFPFMMLIPLMGSMIFSHYVPQEV